VPCKQQQLANCSAGEVALTQSGGIFSTSFSDLERGLAYLNELMSNGGVEYLKMEAPSFERVVMDIVKREMGEK
jgi:hypothetical protein